MASGSSSGMTAESMKGSGKMGSNMGLGFTGMRKARNRRESGMRARESDGLKSHESITISL